MTPVAQTHTELDALLARVKDQIKACELTEAILVDDKLVTEMTDVQWKRAIGKLQAEDAQTYGKIKKLYQDGGHQDVEEYPPDQIHDAAVELVKGSSSQDAVKIINEKHFKEAALDNLVALLDQVGLKPVPHTSVTEQVPRTGKLYFLDYRMDGVPQHAGQHASGLLKELVERADQTPPSAVLMSRGVNTHPTPEEWEKVARDAGYYRFNFRYLDKGKVEKGQMAFLFFLHELLESYPVGKKYYAQLHELRTAAKLAADAALAEIRQLSPAEFRIYAGKYLGDETGRKASRHILNLFLGLLDAEVKNNDTVEAGFRAFADMLMKTPMLATKDKDTHKLHELHTRLLYDRSKWVQTGPVVFGDMYRKPSEPDVYYLVITPECDLDPRNKNGVWLPKADQILLIRGTLTNQPTDKHPENYVGMPFVSEKEARWIRWHLRQALFVPSHELVPKTPAPAVPDPNEYVKWGRLRHVEAEHVQQEYASDLVEVGLDDISGLTQPRSIEFWHVQAGGSETKLEDLVIVETVTVKDEKIVYYCAFGEGCELVLCPDTPGEVFFSFSELVKLRIPTVKKDFIDECKKKNLQFIETEGEPPRFVRSKSSFKGGKGGWKPKTPSEQQTPAGGGSGDAQPPSGPPSGDQSHPPAEELTSEQSPPPERPAVPRGTEATIRSENKVTDLGHGLPTEKKNE